MCSSSSCKCSLCTIEKTSSPWRSQILGGWSAVVMAVVSNDCIQSLSHNCVPKLCLKNKYRQNPIYQNRSQKQPKNF